MIQTQAGYHSDKTHLLLYPSYGTTAYGQALAFHLLLHVCHELKWRKYSPKFNSAIYIPISPWHYYDMMYFISTNILYFI